MLHKLCKQPTSTFSDRIHNQPDLRPRILTNYNQNESAKTYLENTDGILELSFITI